MTHFVLSTLLSFAGVAAALAVLLAAGALVKLGGNRAPPSLPSSPASRAGWPARSPPEGPCFCTARFWRCISSCWEGFCGGCGRLPLDSANCMMYNYS